VKGPSLQQRSTTSIETSMQAQREPCADGSQSASQSGAGIAMAGKIDVGMPQSCTWSGCRQRLGVGEWVGFNTAPRCRTPVRCGHFYDRVDPSTKACHAPRLAGRISQSPEQVRDLMPRFFSSLAGRLESK